MKINKSRGIQLTALILVIYLSFKFCWECGVVGWGVNTLSSADSLLISPCQGMI